MFWRNKKKRAQARRNASAQGKTNLCPCAPALLRSNIRYCSKKDKELTAYRLALNASGFTLIEVLVAIVILATGLVLVIEGMARTQQALRISENLVIAGAFVEKKLTDAELEVRNLKRLGLNHTSGKWKLGGKEFEWTESVGPYNDETILDQTRVNLVEVNLRWPEGPARTGELKLATLVRNRDKKEVPVTAEVPAPVSV